MPVRERDSVACADRPGRDPTTAETALILHTVRRALRLHAAGRGTPPGCSRLPWDAAARATGPTTGWSRSAQRGISRHVVRFVAEAGEVFAIKEIDERLARREYRLLRRSHELGIPAVEVLGVFVDRPGDLDAVLVTRFLDYSIVLPEPVRQPARAAADRPAARRAWSSCWSGCTSPASSGATARCPTRCSGTTPAPSRRTWSTPRRPSCTRRCPTAAPVRRRAWPSSGSAASCSTCRPAGCCADDVDPIEVAEQVADRYDALWNELTREELLQPGRAALPDRRAAAPAQRARLRRRRAGAIEPGRTATGCACAPGSPSPGSTGSSCSPAPGSTSQENQARRLLNDIASFRGWLEQARGPAGAGDGGGQPLARRGLRPGDRRDARRTCAAGSTRPRCSTRSSSTAGSCPSRAAATSAPPAAAADYFAGVLPAVPPDLTVGTGIRGIIGP